MRLRNILIVIGCFLTTITLCGQGFQQSINWRMNVKMTSATEGEVIIKAIPDDGWHLYGMQVPQGGPKATVIDFANSKGIEFITNISYQPQPLKVHDSVFNLELSWWDTTVTFRRKFKVTKSSEAVVNCSISYMGCNNVTCLPPSTKSFSKRINVKK